MEEQKEYTAKDFKSDQYVRWCPGCGDHSIVAVLQRAMATLGVPPHETVVISGIGCSSRLPYYMNAYGFHTIHGRAAAVATGVKTANPDLTVWQISGDGDCLAIGGNHFIHSVRRNVDINVVLMNNKIYGLTKGQYSPTSDRGFVTKSSPYGTVEDPFIPAELVFGARGTFFARSLDVEMSVSQEVLVEAARHKGTSVVELLQNCVIFNDGVYDLYTNKETKDDNVIKIEHGKPLLFGKDNSKGIKLDGWKPTVIDLTDGKNSINDVLVYDETSKELAFIMSSFAENPSLPTPIGVFLCVENRPTYDYDMEAQIKKAQEKGEGDIEELLKGNAFWEI